LNGNGRISVQISADLPIIVGAFGANYASVLWEFDLNGSVNLFCGGLVPALLFSG
jgi:hypothetical protein